MCSSEAFAPVDADSIESRLRKLRSEVDRDRVIGGTGDVLCITPNEVIAWIDECLGER